MTAIQAVRRPDPSPKEMTVNQKPRTRLEAAPAFLGDLLDTLTERGRALLRRKELPEAVSGPDLVSLGELLLSRRGEASGVALAQSLLAAFAAASPDEQLDFLLKLADRFGPDRGAVDAAIEAARKEGAGIEAIEALHAAAEPRRQELIRRLNLAPGGTAALVRMREELLRHLRKHPELRRVDADFAHLFSSWFNRGFLVLRHIDWTTPANILEKIIRYEAVHAIQNWDDLRNRLEPTDRRCYGFFHPQLVDEPLIFVEVALTESIPDRVGALLDLDRTPIDASKASTAVFYSISNTQRGLAGVSFGNFLIKQVVEDLKAELPDIKTFVTLSPVPGFASWLARERESEASEVLDPAAARGAAAARRTRLAPRRGEGRNRARRADPDRRALLPEGQDPRRASGRSGGALSSRQRRAARAAQLPRRRLGQRAAAVPRADGQLPLRARRDRDEPRGARREGRRRRVPGGAQGPARQPLRQRGVGLTSARHRSTPFR